MCAYKSDIHHIAYKDYYRYHTEIISAYIENITTVLYIICRRKRLLQIRMTFPVSSQHIVNPF